VLKRRKLGQNMGHGNGVCVNLNLHTKKKKIKRLKI